MPAGTLAQVLRELPRIDDPNLLVSPERLDDAGVYKLRDDLAIVQTVDFFPPLVDDPFAFGQISAANSLSDVYAMGGTPVSCLNIVGFPDDKLPIEILVEILKGGSDKIVEAGAVLAGGHSVRDAEIKYGLSVTGTVDPRKVIANDGAKPGDKLVLTKPIGSGNLTTAFKKKKLSEDGMQQCIDVMRQLNRAGAEAMTAVGVSAATDITGFGLLGHANEMAEHGLGFPKKDGPEGIAFFELAGTMLSLYPRDKLAEDITVKSEGSGFPGFTLAHNVGSPEMVDATLQEAVSAGAKLIKPGQKVFWGGYSGYFADPDGFYWEIAWNPFL